MKRLLSLVLCFALLLSISSFSVSAANIVDSGTCGKNLTWTLTSEGLLTISGGGEMKTSTFSFPWASVKDSIKMVYIGNNVTSIASNAFTDCTAMTSISIGSGVASIGASALRGCTKLSGIWVDTNNSAFSNDYNGVLFNKQKTTLICCPGGISGAYEIPYGVTSIGRSAFYGCTGLTSVNIPDSVTSIDDYAFYGCTSLTSVSIPRSVTSIGESAFRVCTKLSGIWVDANNSVYSNDDNGVLFNKRKTTLICCPGGISGVYEIPYGVESIGSGAFAVCTNLTSVAIPGGVTSIERGAFYGCAGLTSIAIPHTVTSIGGYAFSDCTGLTSITIPGGVTSIGRSAFHGCTGLTSITIPSGVTSIEDGTFSGCTGLTSVTIPNSVKNIGGSALSTSDGAFSGCTGLTSITIPYSVTTIGNHVFYGCTGLSGILVDTKNPVYSNDGNGVLFNKPKTVLICCPVGISGAYEIPYGVASIKGVAFLGCTKLTSVTIPGSVTSIENSAFSGCTGLTNVAIPDSVTSIDGFAFRDCTGLTSVIIGDSVTKIDWFAFAGCASLTSVCFKGNAPDSQYISTIFCIGYDESRETYINIPGLTLYYIKGRAGWATPRWHGYPTATWDGVNIPRGAEDKPGGFRDVSPTAWYAGAVDYAVSNKLMNGMGGGKFEPNGSMTRAMLVTVLWRYAGSPAEGTNGFSDVPNGDWYTQAVAWASKNGVVNGVGNGRFDPNGKITREQMAVILFRYANQQGINTGKRGDFGKFADANRVSSYAVDALQWAVAEGIVGGSSEGGKLLLNPQGNATRAEVATILMRFLENVMK